MKLLIKNLIYTFLLMANTFDLFSCISVQNIFINSDDESKLMDAVEESNKNGAIINIDTNVINVNSAINMTGDLMGTIKGLMQDNGEYPRIHFVNKDGSNSGVNLYGINKSLQNIIIENANGNGISIFGDYNNLYYVVSRYNKGSGIVVYGDYANINYCYSYRNCDATTNSVNADGFSIYGKTDIFVYYCNAWDNANSGFNFVSNNNSSDIQFSSCSSWNNGNINVFTGKYDFDLGNTLDKNLWTIQEIIKSYPQFASNFYNRQFYLDNTKLDGIPVKEWIAKVEPIMDGNGFILGNKNSSQNINLRINVFNSVAFDNKNGGFIDNYNHKYKIIMQSCAAFNNYINYKLSSYTFAKGDDIWSWLSSDDDQLNQVEAYSPISSDKINKMFYSTRDNIIKSLSHNIFPYNFNFGSHISDIKKY